ncbi:hypothetical protein GCM10010293_15090 [Streptomyces griseoflavus]|uniref:hypothetical protein n=1 Tax=Streptomyces griseoflavus TaxID=35619 RepID=UPI00167E1C9E|nr:hypothetical protein [Streptomyces griseoflavus]GGV19758.1 hypothetical protein GCM10010293_15090 [Streptomyces griseoflavus]
MRLTQPYDRTVHRALRTVPHYRERYAATGTLPPLTRDEARLRRHLLMPLDAALLPRRDPGRPPRDHVAELREALRIAGHPVRGVDVYEVARSLRDPVRAYGTTWRVLLDATAETDGGPTRRALPEGPALVVGDPGWADGPYPDGVVGVARFGLAAAAVAPPAPGSLWYEPWLGYLGAVAPDCGELHLDTARVHARALDGSTVLTLLRRRRPTFVHAEPEGGGAFRPERCPRHGGPVLRPVRSPR